MLFFDTLILLYCLRRDGGSRLGTVVGLRVGRSGRYRPPCLATRHSERNCATGQQRQYNRFNDFVLLVGI